ncbi:MAG: hypothetical protein KGJ55_05955 [Gammaproteobacteria bacterium]|nr:hypothetical protein [Gammaproteobacteria bacterium]
MAGKSGKKAQPQAKPLDEFDDDGGSFEEEVPNLDADETAALAVRSRDWRDVEKYREIRELRRLIGDDFDDLSGQPSLPPPPVRNKTRSKKATRPPSRGASKAKRPARPAGRSRTIRSTARRY